VKYPVDFLIGSFSEVLVVICYLVCFDVVVLVAGSLKPHRRTKSESDAKHKISANKDGAGPEAKKPKLERRRSSTEDPPNDKKPPEVEGWAWEAS